MYLFRGRLKMSSKGEILIIDDDQDFQVVLKQCLNKEGYSCTACGSAEEGLKQVRRSMPDLVILDLGFSNASGMAFLENYSATLSHNEKPPPVMVVSGYSDPEVIELVKTRGATAFLSKPVGAREIISAVRTYIQPANRALYEHP